MLKFLKYRFWALPTELKRHGVLGINSRNMNLLLKLNPRSSYPKVDNKMATKKICEACHVPVPETYAVIKSYGEISKSLRLMENMSNFVIKPARGAEGRGIIVVLRSHEKKFETSKGESLSLAQIRYHLSTILSGLYSLGGNPDQAIIEERITPHPIFANFAMSGTPDIRLIIYKGVPVMGMLRLPTKTSNGRANLHQGGIGAAIDLRTGQTFGGVCKNRFIDVHPDTGVTTNGIEIPDWMNILAVAMKLSDAIDLDYLGVDFVLDVKKGSVVIEANARPGLSIQIANQCGLWPKLNYVDLQPAHTLSIKERLKLIVECTSSLDTKKELINPVSYRSSASMANL